MPTYTWEHFGVSCRCFMVQGPPNVIFSTAFDWGPEPVLCADRYHLRMWRDHASTWLDRVDQKPTLVVRMEDFKLDCVNSLGRVMDWLGVKRRSQRLECACSEDHRAKRSASFVPKFSPDMLSEAAKQVSVPAQTKTVTY